MERAASRPATASDSPCLPWTATRCHRLLRPLLTHVSGLRKEVSRQHPRESLGDALPQNHGNLIYDGGVWGLGGSTGSNIERPRSGADSTKLLSRKRVQHTYSLKASKRPKIGKVAARTSTDVDRLSARRYAMPPEPNMCLATPIIRRVQGQWSSPLVPEPVAPESEIPARFGRCYHSHGVCVKKCSFEDRLLSLKTTTAPSTFALYESIYRAFDALLRATTAAEAQVAKPKSLMAMCLRKVPAYVAELESWRLHELEETGTSSAFDGTNTSFDVYSDLESLGMGSCGWKHLAIVVQSHGIRIVKDAILERLMADDFAILLSDLCSELKVAGDRRQLLEAVVTQQHREPGGPLENFSVETSSTSSEALPLLFATTNDRTGTTIFKARLTTTLLSSQLLPRQWLLSDVYGDMWPTAMRYLTGRASYPDAIPFCIASIQLYCDQIQQNARRSVTYEESAATAQQLLLNLLAALSTLVLLGQDTLARKPDSTKRNVTFTLCRRVEYVLRACLASVSNPRGRATRQASTYVLLLAVFLITEEVTKSEISGCMSREARLLADFWTRVVNDSKQHTYRQYYEATMALMASIARGCTRKNATKPAHTYLIKLCDKLEAACPKVTALKAIRVDAAFYLADLTGDLRDLSFAEQLAAATQADADMTKTPGRKTAAFSGFRWDEGISEWVTVTPAVARRKQPLPGRVTRARRDQTPEKPASTQDAEIPPRSSPSVPASSRVLGIDPEEISGFAVEHRPCRARTSAEPGTSCHAKRPRKQLEQQTHHTRDKPGVHTPKPGRPTRASQESVSGVGGIDRPGDDDLDELRFDQADQENRPPSRRAAKAQVPLKRKRSRRSLISLRPIQNISNEYYDAGESSGDELGIT